MKTLNTQLLMLAIIANALFSANKINAQAKNISFEKLSNECKGIKRADRVRITVARFSVSSRAAQATGQFGEELTTIMTNALQNTNCFRVLESIKNADDMSSEIGYNESGATNGSGPTRGKQMGAQAVVTAEITEFNDGTSSGGAFGLSFGKSKAKIGLIVKVLDPASREIIWSQSVNGEASKGGFSGAKILGVNVAGSSKVSEAMSGAIEDLVFNTVSLMVKEKDQIISEFDPNDGMQVAKNYNKTNCPALSNYTPKIMVIVPEFHISARIPDPAGETEILRKFLEAGFKAVDPSMYATLRNGAKFSEAVKNPMAAVSLGKEFGADIVIFGEGFSEFVSRQSNTVTCRARVEVRAVRTDNAEIIATNGAQAGGLDLVESTSSKTALKNAGGQIADYLLGQICEKSMKFVSSNSSPNKLSNSKINNGSLINTIITINNANFSKMNNLVNKLRASSKVKDISDKKLVNSVATLTLSHEGSTDAIVEILGSILEIEITGVYNGKISVFAK